MRWSPPPGWTGPESLHFWSFDTLDYLTLNEFREQSDFDALVAGKVSVHLKLLKKRSTFTTSQHNTHH